MTNIQLTGELSYRESGWIVQNETRFMYLRDSESTAAEHLARNKRDINERLNFPLEVDKK